MRLGKSVQILFRINLPCRISPFIHHRYLHIHTCEQMAGEQKQPTPQIYHIPRRCAFDSKASTYSEMISQAVNLLKQEKLIAVPTDTIYGIACLAQSQSAVDAIYHCKRRSTSKPLAICVADIDSVYKYGSVPKWIPRGLIEDLLPGPVTVVFERSKLLNPGLNPNTSLVGIRIPDDRFINDLVRALGGEALALTSANISDGMSPLSIHDFRELWGSLAAVFDGGLLSDSVCSEPRDAKARSGSTVVCLAGKQAEKKTYEIFRNGR